VGCGLTVEKRTRPVFPERRVPISEANPDDIKISETAVFAPDALLLRVFLYLEFGYYLSHYLPLAIGLSVVHQQEFSLLFALAVLSPVTLLGNHRHYKLDHRTCHTGISMKSYI
jgi:hypothetical protein